MDPVLQHTVFTAPGEAPGRYLLFLHGLLGTGANWRSYARRLVETRPDWGAVTVDLRMHGASQGFAPPHTLDAAAEDLRALASQLPGPIAGVLGHSLGGKVALAYFARRSPALTHLLVLDSNPGPQSLDQGSEQTLEVLAVLEQTRFPFRTQQDFWAQMQRGGLSHGVAQWLGMNLTRRPDGYHFAPDLRAMRALLEDYARRDLWGVVDPPPVGSRIGFLLGGRSSTCDDATRRRLQALAVDHPGFTVQVLPQAGHWVHVDDAEGTFRFITGMLEVAT